MTGSRLIKLLKLAAGLILAGALIFLGLRIYISEQGPPLEPWHTLVPDELTAEEIDRADWDRYTLRG